MKRPIREFLSKDTMINVIGIPKKFAEKTLEDFETPTEILEHIKLFVRNYLKNIYKNFDNGKGIFFSGSNGAGKTMLSSIILKYAYQCRYSCKRITFNDYVREYTGVWYSRGEEREFKKENLYTNIKGVEFLVLEELGKEIQTKLDVNSILEDLLRYREDKGYPTIFTANISLEKVREKYGESIYSLIYGNNSIIEIETFDGREKFRKGA